MGEDMEGGVHGRFENTILAFLWKRLSETIKILEKIFNSPAEIRNKCIQNTKIVSATLTFSVGT
jgi:hypothetical protein